MNKCILEAVGLCKEFEFFGSKISVIKNISLKVYGGESVSIVGGSGSGKSTLLHILGGLTDPTHGTVSLNGKCWSEMCEKEKSIWRNKNLGFVYQSYHLLPEFSALDNVAMPLRIGGFGGNVAREKSAEILVEVGLGNRLSHRPSELSGGERQRVAIARSLVCSPSIVLADEPTGNLDVELGREAFEVMSRLSKSKGLSLVVVTHDPSIALKCDRTISL
jgi:lipoprotein-releasing system ATP-binding protein